MNDSIKKKLWFEDGCICILTDKGEKYSQRLEVFPSLFCATQSQRENTIYGMTAKAYVGKICPHQE